MGPSSAAPSLACWAIYRIVSRGRLRTEKPHLPDTSTCSDEPHSHLARADRRRPPTGQNGRVQKDEALNLLRVEAERILSILRRPEVDLATSLPACPGWTLEDLGDHLGKVYAMVAAAIQLGTTSDSRPPREALSARQPGTGVVEWLSARLAELLTVFDQVADGHRCWNFLGGAGSDVAFWWRRQAHETLIHRADAELALVAKGEYALGGPVPPAAIVATDGVSEFLELSGYQPVSWEDLRLGEAMTIHLHATDAEKAEWTIDTEEKAYAPAHLKADVAVRGPAWAIDLWLWRRGSLAGAGVMDLSSRLEGFGDWPAAEQWRPSR